VAVLALAVMDHERQWATAGDSRRPRCDPQQCGAGGSLDLLKLDELELRWLVAHRALLIRPSILRVYADRGHATVIGFRQTDSI